MGRGSRPPDCGSRPLVCEDRIEHGADTLTIAASTNGYTLTDRGTWAQFRDRRNLEILVDHDARLYNQYSAMLVSSSRHPKVKADLGMTFIDWLTSQQGQDAIAGYKVAGEQLFSLITPGRS